GRRRHGTPVLVTPGTGRGGAPQSTANPAAPQCAVGKSEIHGRDGCRCPYMTTTTSTTTSPRHTICLRSDGSQPAPVPPHAARTVPAADVRLHTRQGALDPRPGRHPRSGPGGPVRGRHREGCREAVAGRGIRHGGDHRVLP